VSRAIRLLVLALVVAACGSHLTPIPVPSTSPAVSSDAKGGYVDPSRTPTPHSSAPPYPTGTPGPGEAARAAALLERYERALVDGDWTTAYGMLSAAQRSMTTFREFSSERSAFFRSVAGRFSLEPVLHDRQTIETWTADATSTRDADLASAFVITVDYPAIAADTNANFDVFLVAPDRSGTWWIWPLR
jgi:hypothetical protein